MGKPGAELPDSIDPAPPASAEKVDDLLAQMAGEEIDRLLSESEDLRETAVTKQNSPANESEPAIGRQLDALFSGSDDEDQPGNGHAIKREEKPLAPVQPSAAVAIPPPAQAPVAARPVPPSEDEVSQQLTDLFNDEDPAAPAAPNTQKPEKAEKVESAQPPAAASPAPAAADLLDEEFHTESSPIDLERAELIPPAQQEPTSDDLTLHLGSDENESMSNLLAMLLKPLEWLTRPMVACPDHLRDLIGKIALLTLFNATAVLIYVFLFRRHH